MTYNNSVINPTTYMKLPPDNMLHVLTNGNNGQVMNSIQHTPQSSQSISTIPSWYGTYNSNKNDEHIKDLEKPIDESQSQDLITFNTKSCESLFTDELRTDFDDFKRMTLIDDYQLLDDLYSYSSQFNNSQVAASMIISLYRNKYKELFERYPSLSSYTLFVVIVIIENSFTGFMNIFKNLKTENKLAIKPQAVRNSKFSLVYRKRKLDTACVDDARGRCNKAPDDEVMESSKRAKREHPLFSTNFYVKNHILFNIGEIWKYLLPSEFAIFVVRLKKTPVKIYGQTQKTVSGVAANFNVPILFTINKRTNKGNEYHNMEYTERLHDYMKLAFDKDMYAFNFSVLKNQKLAKLIKTTEHESEANGKVLLASNDEHKYIILDNMQFWNNANIKDSVTNRGFSDTIYYMTPNTFKKYTETEPNDDADDDDDRMFNNLVEYYKKHNPEYLEKLVNGPNVDESDNVDA